MSIQYWFEGEVIKGALMNLSNILASLTGALLRCRSFAGNSPAAWRPACGTWVLLLVGPSLVGFAANRSFVDSGNFL